ncbi:hypothetical protein [Streptomyces ipomoeae]|uniref:hypothetical protein n=1 Tax=Streptomyces ipomoeae TaxID=103232 RepID=UPI0038D3BDB2
MHAIGTDRIMFSVDYPYSGNVEARAFFDGLPLSQPDRDEIAHGNTEKLLNPAVRQQQDMLVVTREGSAPPSSTSPAPRLGH